MTKMCIALIYQHQVNGGVGLFAINAFKALKIYINIISNFQEYVYRVSY